jgi:C4-dicarboxylate transporter DctQ subunit
MVWIVFIGGSVIVRTRGHIAVDVVPNFLSGPANRRLKLAVTALSFVFFVGLLYYSAQHTLRIRASGQVMPAMQAPMWLAYLAMPVGSLLMAIRTLQVAARIWASPAVGVTIARDLGD